MNKRLLRVLLDKLKRSFEMLKYLTEKQRTDLRAMIHRKMAKTRPALQPVAIVDIADIPTRSLPDLPALPVRQHLPHLSDEAAYAITQNEIPVVRASTPDPRIYTTDPEQEVAEPVAKQGTDAIEARSVVGLTDKIMARPITGAIQQVESRPKPTTGKLAATKLKPAKSPYIRHRQSGTAICEAMREALALFEVKHATTRIDHVKMTSLGAMCLRMADSVGQYANLKIEETNSLPDGDRLAFDEIMVVGPTVSGWLL